MGSGVAVCFLLVFWFCGSVLTDKDIFPKIYNLESYSKCRSNNENYCFVATKLHSKNNESEVWQNIEKSVHDVHVFRKDYIYRGICVPKSVENVKKYSWKKVKREVETFDLNPEIETVDCRNKFQMYKGDYFVGFCLFAYFSFIIVTTLRDLYLRKKDSNKAVNEYLATFSVVKSYEKLTKPIKNVTYQKLKSIQGIKTYSTILVVTGHTILATFCGFLDDTQSVEKMMQDVATFFHWGMFLVQPFFMFSGWLLATQVYQFWESTKPRGSHVFQAILIRALRLWPSLIFTLMINQGFMSRYLLDGPVFQDIQKEQVACTNNPLPTLLFYSNLLEPNHMCHLIAWYLSADMQLFCFSMFVLFVIYKFKLPVVRTLVAVIVGTILLQASLMYKYNLDVVYKVIPNNFQLYQAQKDFTPLLVWYFSPISNASTYILGVLFGILTCKYSFDIKIPSSVKLSWLLLFVGIPLLATKLSTYEYNQLNSALLGAFLKSFYSLGIAIGVFGMAQNIGGIIKKTCEFPLVEFLSKITFNTYLNHTPLVFYTFVTSEKLLQASYVTMFFQSVFNSVLAFSFGFVMTLVVEVPWANVLSLLLKKSSAKEDIKNE